MSPGLQSLIIVSLVKCPTTGVIIINAQDRNVVFQPNQTTQASKWYYQPSVVPNTGFGCYALDDPTVMFTTVASVARSSDAGATLPDIAFSYNLPFGGVQSLTINAAGSGYTSNGVHTNVSLIGGSGSGATADITITGGVVTAATPNVPGDLYAEYFPSLGVAADVFSFSDASVGGRTGGSAASIAVHEVGMFKTTNTSTTVTVTDKGQGTGFAGHGLTTGDKVGFANVINTNNAIVNNTSLTVTVTDSNHYTIVSSTTANATGVFGGYGGYLNFNGVYRGINGYSGGLSNIVAPTKRDVFCIGGGGFAANYGISTDDVNYFWNAATGPGGTVLRGFGGNAFGKNKPLAIETATGKMAYIEYDFGSPNQDRANSFLVSTDKGHTWTCPGGVGNLTSTWTGFAGGGTGANLSSVTGHNTHWFAGGGFPGDNSINITTLYLRRTRDDGSTWDEFTTNTGFAMFVCAGPNAVGASYPSIYMYGLANGNVFPNFALYRCDNMTGVSGDTTACIWKELPNMIKVDCSSITGLTPDYDIPGRIYILTGDEGYMYTTLT
jgi:hypothetical protein